MRACCQPRRSRRDSVDLAKERQSRKKLMFDSPSGVDEANEVSIASFHWLYVRCACFQTSKCPLVCLFLKSGPQNATLKSTDGIQSGNVHDVMRTDTLVVEELVNSDNLDQVDEASITMTQDYRHLYDGTDEELLPGPAMPTPPKATTPAVRSSPTGSGRSGVKAVPTTTMPTPSDARSTVKAPLSQRKGEWCLTPSIPLYYLGFFLLCSLLC